MSAAKTPLVIAHRGERVLTPENTLEACRRALAQGATGLEVDVRLCSSGELVLFHDPLLWNHFGKFKSLASSSLAELKSLSFSKNHYRFPDQICTLEEFLEEFKGKVPINLDAKSWKGNHRRVAAALTEIISRFKVYDQVWVSSFNPLILKKIKQRKSTIRTGYLFQNPAPLHKMIDVFLSTDAWHPHYKNVSRQFIERARKLGKEVYIWTVNEPAVLKRIMPFDFDGIITDTFFRTRPFSDNHRPRRDSSPDTF